MTGYFGTPMSWSGDPPPADPTHVHEFIREVVVHHPTGHGTYTAVAARQCMCGAYDRDPFAPPEDAG